VEQTVARARVLLGQIHRQYHNRIAAAFLGLSGRVTHVRYALACHLTLRMYATMQLGVGLEALFGTGGAVLTKWPLQWMSGTQNESII
jgi:hypothetical protein